MHVRPTYTVLMLLAVFALTTAFIPTPAKTQEIKQAPPEPIYEVNPGERPGFILSPGYWRWNGTRHVWRPARWVAIREGYLWTPDRWEQRGDKWTLAAGHWAPDPAYVDIEEDVSSQSVSATETRAAEPVKKYTKRVRKPDYSDPTQYPRYIRR